VGVYQTIRPEKIKGIFKRYLQIPLYQFSSLEKYTIVDEAMYLSKQRPGMYNPVRLELIKDRIPAVKIRQESDKEKEQKKDETKRRNDPSPCSYK